MWNLSRSVTVMATSLQEVFKKSNDVRRLCESKMLEPEAKHMRHSVADECMLC